MTSFRAAREAVYDAQGRSDFNRCRAQPSCRNDAHMLSVLAYTTVFIPQEAASYAAVIAQRSALIVRASLLSHLSRDGRPAALDCSSQTCVPGPCIAHSLLLFLPKG